VVTVASLGSLVSSLSASVVGVVLPRIGAWADLGVLDVQWVSLVPMLVISAALLPVGRLGDLVGHKKVYLAGIALVGLGGLGCALAPGFVLLLTARAVSGIGAAMTMATAPAMVSLASGPGHRGRALGLVSTAIYVGLTFGPPLGGLLDSFGGFRSVFWFQVPVAALIFLFTLFAMPEMKGEEDDSGIDHAGALLLILGLVGLLLALSRIGQWSGTLLAACGALGVIGLAAFVFVERRVRAPMLDLALFRDRTFTSAAIGAFLNYVAIFHVVFLLPFYLEDILGIASREAGLFLMAMPMVMSVVAGPSGYLSDRVGSRIPSFVGMLIMAVGIAWLTMLNSVSTPVLLVAATCVVGLGTGVFISPNTNTLMSAAPRTRQGSAAGIMALARTVGMMAGITISAGIYGTLTASAKAAGLGASEAGVTGLRAAWWVAAFISVVGAFVVLIRAKGGNGPVKQGFRIAGRGPSPQQ